MAVVLALEVFPHTLKAFVVNEPGDVDPHVTSTRETLDVFVLRREAVISPLLDEALPLVWRVGQKPLLRRHNGAVRHLGGRNSGRWARRLIDVLPTHRHDAPCPWLS